MEDVNKHDGFEERLLSPERKKVEDPEKFLPRLLKRGDVAAEFGSGPGYYSVVIARYVSRLYCIEKNSRSLSIARQHVSSSNVLFLNEDSTKTSVPSASVDVVVLANAFHDMDRKGTADEIVRVMNAEGRIVVVDWNKAESDMGPPFELRMNEQDYLSFFKDFIIREKFIVGPDHYGVVLVHF
jgi:ubiquinone/menaquinone biosynthesis C-methylase UbiE